MNNTDNIIKDLLKEFEGYIGSLSNLEEIKTIPFGIKSLDAITGRNGIPLGMITEIYGAESSGKTSLALKLISEAQKMDFTCGFIDTELAITKDLAQKSGVNINNLIIARPRTGENAFEILEGLIEKGAKLIVIDSVSSLVPSAELEADYTQESIGLQARLMSKGMRKIIGCMETNKSAVVFINQVRDNIGKFGFGPQKTTSGGRALKFYSAMRIEMARTRWIESTNGKVGMCINIKMVKNKIFRPQLDTNVNFMFDTGFDVDGDLLNFMVNSGKLKLIGRTYYYGNENIGVKSKALIYLKEHNL